MQLKTIVNTNSTAYNNAHFNTQLHNKLLTLIYANCNVMQLVTLNLLVNCNEQIVFNKSMRNTVKALHALARTYNTNYKSVITVANMLL